MKLYQIKLPLFRPAILLLVTGLLLASLPGGNFSNQSAKATVIDTACRFGITSPLGSDGYPIAVLGVGSYLDWGAVTNPVLPDGVEYIRVLRLRDDLYLQTLANLPAWIQANPGSVWVVGNEPDTTFGDQDELLPEVYADRYYEVARIIRRLDRTAQIAFGSIVQPTPIRMRYLDRAWNQLVAVAGGSNAASRLIDIWSIHSFILNEESGFSWGTGIPPGFENDFADAVIIDLDHIDYTYSIAIFQQRVVAFRSWMAEKGERDKPLWITEYGSLFPPIDPPGVDYVNVGDVETYDFMLATFDFLLGASDDQSGLPSDANRLVQRWFWYSLNEHRYNFGGTVFDPDNNKLPTEVGDRFIEYQSTYLTQPDLVPTSLAIAPISFNPDRTLVNYQLDITIDNSLFDDATCAQVWIYDGDPEKGGSLIAGPIPSSAIRSNYGVGRLTAYWMNVEPLTQYTLSVLVQPVGVDDVYPDDNLAFFSVYTELPEMLYFPSIFR